MRIFQVAIIAGIGSTRKKVDLLKFPFAMRLNIRKIRSGLLLLGAFAVSLTFLYLILFVLFSHIYESNAALWFARLRPFFLPCALLAYIPLAGGILLPANGFSDLKKTIWKRILLLLLLVLGGFIWANAVLIFSFALSIMGT